MSVEAGNQHHSIGDVLGMLREEFPDITISKIRFLESQGLIDPERTPSGYRKFYDGDVARLRWILHQQKEHFLPLKVIKGRLEQLELGGGVFTEDLEIDAVLERTAEGSVEEMAPAVDAGDAASPGPGQQEPKPKVKRRSRKKAAAPPSLPLDDGRADDLAVDPSGVSLTREELAKAAGLTDAEITELESFGLLIPSTEAGGRVLFDEDGLAVARLAAGFAKHGIEARHLRMYRSFAEREAILYQQALLSVLRQRNPEARARAQEELAELAKLGRGLRTAYLRQAARELLAGVIPPTILDRRAIAGHVARLGTEIDRDHPDGVVLVGVLKGALIFLADLARAMPGAGVHLDFIAISRYAPDSGRVRITQDLERDVTGRDVVLVEDLVDTGLTLAYLVRLLEGRGARQVRICALLDRPARRIVPLDVHYRGVEIPDVYVLGYGLHHADLYRNLPDVYEADRAVIREDPAAYVADLYGRAST